jgi:glycosyltransferase involved in cell wall biosynthesis
VDRFKVAIVIPAFNEENTVASVVRPLLTLGTPIVVDDGSVDSTVYEASKAGAVVVKHDVNRGYDAALNSGFIRAAELGCEYVVTMDADGQHDCNVIEQIISLLNNGSDVVLGIRDKMQRLGERCFACMTKYYLGIQDPLCGMKGYKLTVYIQLGHFDSFNSIGTELAVYSAINKFKIDQIPIVTENRVDNPRFGSLLSANLYIFRAMLITFLNIKTLSNKKKIKASDGR